MPSSRRLHSDKSRSQGIKEYLKGREKRFSKNVVQAEQFKIGGEISVNAILSEMLVVLYVIFLERGGIGYSYR